MIAWVQTVDAVYEIATDADRRSDARVPERPVFDVHSLLFDPRSSETMRSIVRLLERGREHGSDRELADTILRLVEFGAIQVRLVATRARPTVLQRSDGVIPSDPESLAELAAQHFVEFRFVDSQGNPVGGIPYIFTDAGGDQEPGTLGRDGRIRRDRIEDGTYGVELQQVISAQWEQPTALCDDAVALRARVTGFHDGTKVTARIFREFSETDADVIDTIKAEVVAGEASFAWQYDYAGDEDRAGAQGTVAFVAEVSVANGSWAKTLTPLTMTLKTIALADWTHEDCESGTAVELFAQVAGFSAAATATFSIYRVTPQGDGERVATLDAASVTAARIACPWVAPDQAGEFYFEITVDDVVTRTAVSDLLCVRGRGGRRG